MDSSIFKTAVVGGFERQSVIDYIEKTAKENTEQSQLLQTELEALSAEKTAQDTELQGLRSRVEYLEKENARLTEETTAGKAARESMERQLAESQPQLADLEAELELLRPEAEAYARVKAHIGDIECNARKRADELESSVTAKLSNLLRTFKMQYHETVSTLEVTSNHVVGELRKVEVNLSQLPVTFDKMNGELAELESVLNKES